MSEEKQVIFLVNDPQFGWIIGGNVDQTLEWIRHSYLDADETKDGAEIDIEIKRQDMTEDELQSAPVI